MASCRLRHASRKGPGHAESGQGLVEFALVGGLFFFLVFSILNAGFFLYGRNAVEHAADIGIATLAAEGNMYVSSSNNADQIAISRMDSAGLTTTPLVSVSEIDIWHDVQNSSTGVLSHDTTGCSGSCENRYNGTGTALNSLPWTISTRNVSGTPDFAELDITYTYHLLLGGTSWTMTTQNAFRLEPQT